MYKIIKLRDHVQTRLGTGENRKVGARLQSLLYESWTTWAEPTVHNSYKKPITLPPSILNGI